MKRKQHEIFSDDNLAEFKRKTENVISTTQDNIKKSGWMTPEGFKNNLASVVEDSVRLTQKFGKELREIADNMK